MKKTGKKLELRSSTVRALSAGEVSGAGYIRTQPTNRADGCMQTVTNTCPQSLEPTALPCTFSELC